MSEVDPSRKSPRVWPGLLIVAIFAFSVFVPGAIAPRTAFHFMGIMFGMLASLLGTIIWWGFFSRTSTLDRVSVLATFVGGAMAVGTLLHPSQIMALVLYAFPLVAVLWVGWLEISGGVHWGTRRLVLMILIALGWASFSLVRIKSVDGDMLPDVRWRWSKTSEELLLEEHTTRQPAPAPAREAPVLVARPGDWTGFRGPSRDGKAVGERVRTDWEANPPKQLWKRRVGLGWSSVCVVGDHLFTQEQRLNEDCVVAYDARTGDERWKFSVAERFIDGVGGDGPRGTPTFDNGRLYAQGATGKLVCLDAVTGKSFWVRDIGKDASAKPPQWGFSGSPLVIDDLVIATPSGNENRGTIAYRKSDGEPVWTSGESQHSYSSPQEATFFGVRQILVVSDFGLESFNPADGKILWSHPVPIRGMNRVVQPNVIGEGDVLLGTGAGSGLGTLLVRVRKSGEQWTVEPGWNSSKLKPYYNDFVSHRGYAYGFDDSIFACIDLKDGRQKWKAGRYGHGQVLLLPDQNKLLVVSETGKVVLLDADPEEPTELASFQAIKGKTWNHPVVVRGKLFVRNDEEMACYDLSEKSLGE